MVPLLRNLSMLILVFAVLVSAPLNASEQELCIPTDTELVGHYDGDGDEVPPESKQHATHHHGSCAGHQVFGSPSLSLMITVAETRMLFPKLPNNLRDLGPQDLLRPPIA